MRRSLLAWLAAAGIAAGFLGHTGRAQTSPAEREVMQAIDQINMAFQKRDTKGYEALTTADFVRVTSAGEVVGRGEWLTRIVGAAGPERGPGQYDEVSVRIYGNAAVVTYRNMPAGAGGQPGVVSYLTRVMEKQGTQWKMALAQSTDVKPPAPPAGPAPQPLPAWSASSAAEKEALAAFQAIQKANQKRDLAAWEKLSASDHVIIAANGTRTSRAERVAALKAPPTGQPVAPGPDQNVRIMVKGDVAAVTWTAGEARSLKVLARRGGQWQQVLQQSSPIVAAKK